MDEYLASSLELDELLKAKLPNGSYVIKKDHRLKVIRAAILLRKVYEEDQRWMEKIAKAEMK